MCSQNVPVRRDLVWVHRIIHPTLQRSCALFLLYELSVASISASELRPITSHSRFEYVGWSFGIFDRINPLKTKYKYWQNKLFLQKYYFVFKKILYWYDIVNFWVHKNLLFYYCLLSPCIVTCKIYLVSSIAILFIVIVSNICNKQNSTVANVTINIFLFLNMYYI